MTERTDTERLDWLEKHKNRKRPSYGYFGGSWGVSIPDGLGHDDSGVFAETLRVAIDAAMDSGGQAVTDTSNEEMVYVEDSAGAFVGSWPVPTRAENDDFESQRQVGWHVFMFLLRHGGPVTVRIATRKEMFSTQRKGEAKP